MQHDFWHKRWEKNEIGFHESEGSYLLKTYFKDWNLAPKSRIFVPLCGKTRDIAWLLNNEFDVVANELNEDAIKALFEELGIIPTIKKQGVFVQYTAPNLLVFVGDFFALSSNLIGKVDGIYDRAALVALPSELRTEYTQHLIKISQKSKQFLITFDYDQTLFNGPPFSVSNAEVKKHYAASYQITLLYNNKIEGGFKGHNEVDEAVYILK